LDNKEFDIKCGHNIIEVDSDYHHPKILKNLSLIQVSSVINDYEKTVICEKHGLNLLRINTSKCNKVEDINLDYIKNNSYKQDFTLNYGDVILSKEYLTKYIQVNGKDKLLRYVPLLLKFIRTFQKEFPKVTTDEDVNQVIKKIGGSKKLGYDVKDGFVYFNNNTSNVGVSLLKSSFDNYWLSSYKGNKSPVELWFDDDFMMKIIKYRIGLNDSGEVFDFSLKNILKGFSSNRITISFFKPLLASNIYKHYLGDIEKPVVFDPCFGFGGRLLGFKSTYPDGEYIGIDPDVNGYKNMLRLSGDIGGVSLYNAKLEDFDIKGLNYDIAFTSIPYYDLETYSDNVVYQNFEDWKNTFINKLLKLPRLLVNMSYKLCEELNLTEYIDSFIESNTSHFNKKTNKKLEVIVKLNF